MPVTMRGPDGQTIAAEDAKVNFWVNQGYRPIAEAEIGQEIAARAAIPDDRGLVGDINAFATSALSGLTAGGSDVILSGLMNRGQRERLAADIDQSPIAAGVGRIGGELLPFVATGGESSLLEATPAAKISKFATSVGEALPIGEGAAARVGRLAATGATEGALSNAGQYLGAMAIQDKPASAEGFLASMKDGALYGGGAAGALGVAGEGLIAARRLLPDVELTPVAARRAREAAVQEVSHAVDESRELENVGRAKARALREQAAAANPQLRAELDQIALNKAKELSDAQIAQARARQVKLEADAAAAQSKAEAAAARAERAKNPPKRQRGKKNEPPQGGIPQTAEDVHIEGAETTVSARELAQREFTTLPGVGEDAVKMEKARKAIAEGQKEPIKINVSPQGKLDIEDGRHRFAAAVEADVPIKVKWQRGSAGLDEAPVPSAPSAVPDLDSELGRQLQATKDAIDNGADIGALSARKKETLVEDALNARVAQESPEMARLLKHLDGIQEARSAVASWLDKHPKSKLRDFEYVEGMRKQSGWRDVLAKDSQRPGFSEGSLAAPRGRQGVFLGDEAARQSFERKTLRKDLHRRIEDPLASAEEKAEAQSILDQMNAESEARKAEAQARAESEARKTAKQIVESSDEQIAQAPKSVDEHVDEALNGHTDLADDVDDASEAIGALEQSSADLVDELGPEAPPVAAERAQVYRETQAKSEASAAQATEESVADAEKAAKVVGLGETPQARKAGGLLSKAETAGQMLEALQLLGVPVPSPSRLPVVGPLLSLYLKAKLAHRAVSRIGGKVPRTTETEIARRAAETKSKIIRAADRALANSAKAARAAARNAPAATTAILGTKLFDDRDPGTPEKKPPADDLNAVYLARRDELERAMVPGAVRDSLRRRIKTADSELLDAIASAEEAKLKFLYDKMPKSDNGVLGIRKAQVSRAALETWAKYVGAALRPVETMEAVLDGELSSAEAAETLRAVNPLMVQDVTARIVEKSTEGPIDIPYKRRVQLSTMLGIPLDDSQSPETAGFMGMLYQPKPPPAPTPPMNAQITTTAPQRVDPETRV